MGAIGMITEVNTNVPTRYNLNIDQFLGLNLTASIKDNELEVCDNLVMFGDYKLKKRFGYKKLYTGTGNINGIFIYEDVFYFAQGTKLYKLNLDNTAAQVCDGLADHELNIFQFNGLVYIIDGTHYWQFNGTTLTDVAAIAYIPTLLTACNSAGAGTAVEQFNLLTGKFKVKINGDNTKSVYTINYACTSTPIKVTLDNVDYMENAASPRFTVVRNSTNTVITFNPAPTTGTTNIIVTAEVTSTEYVKIAQTTHNVIYGGSNDTHVILSYKNGIYRGAVMDPTYFPENTWQEVGDINEDITGFTIQYDTCVIFKEHSIYGMTFTLDNNSNAVYTTRPLNNTVGCAYPNTLQLIENNPLFLDDRGIYSLTQSAIREEKNVTHMSQNIDRASVYGISGLLQEANLENAISIDYDSKYILCINSRFYIYDYRYDVWYTWSNIPAKRLIELDDNLYFTDTTSIYRFKVSSDLYPYNDNDNAVIHVRLESKRWDMDIPERQKTVSKGFVGLNAGSRSSVDIYYRTQDNEIIYIDRPMVDLISYLTFDYSRFTYICTTFPIITRENIKAKKLDYFQIILDSSYDNESLEIINLRFIYNILGYMR
jgi:hypothetical protein